MRPDEVMSVNTLHLAKKQAAHHRRLAVSRQIVRKKINLKKKVVKKPSQKIHIHKKSVRSHKKPVNRKVSLSGIAACIAKYESGGNPRAQNPNSSASGLFQFTDGTWHAVTGLSGSAKDYPVSVQTRAFYKLWDNGRGASHWVVAPRCGY